MVVNVDMASYSSSKFFLQEVSESQPLGSESLCGRGIPGTPLPMSQYVDDKFVAVVV